MEVTSRLKKDFPGDAILTRYVDIHSFLYFITQSKLRFARLDTFEDLNEGYSHNTISFARDLSDHSESFQQINDKDRAIEELSRLRETRDHLAEHYRQYQKGRFACCWYMGKKESVAMWNLYSNSDSVAIRFPANLLIDIVRESASREDQHFKKLQYGVVEYADLSSANHPVDENCTGFLKDDSFRHEQEFRFMAERKTDDDELGYELCLGDLKQIDFRIISHPKMEEWKIRNILNVLSCYDLSEKFLPSALALKNNFSQSPIR